MTSPVETNINSSGHHTTQKAPQTDRRHVLDRREAAASKKAGGGHEIGTKMPTQAKNETAHRAY